MGAARNTFDMYRGGGFGQWLGRGFWAVTDQGLFAFSNFALNILLIRWLSPHDYGAFSIGFVLFLLVSTLYASLVLEPMLVFGAGRYRERISEYMDILLYVHVALASLTSILLLMAALGFKLSGSSTLYSTLLGFALATPFILLLWLMRTSSYVYLLPYRAAASGLLYLVLILIGIGVVHQRTWLSAFSAMIVIGLSSLVAALWLASRLRQRLPRLRGNGLIHATIGNHWGYGRWAAATAGLALVPSNIWYLVLPVWGGLAASGALKALTILIMPLGHALHALSIVLLSSLVRAREHDNFQHLMRSALIVFTSVAGLYWILLGLLRNSLLAWLYSGQYGEYGNLLWLIGFQLPIEGVAGVLRTALQALERPDRVFWAYVLSSAAAVIALPLAVTWGIAGVSVVILLTQLVEVGSTYISYRRLGNVGLFRPAVPSVATH